jgi:hypothetical protein
MTISRKGTKRRIWTVVDEDSNPGKAGPVGCLELHAD